MHYLVRHPGACCDAPGHHGTRQQSELELSALALIQNYLTDYYANKKHQPILLFLLFFMYLYVFYDLM